MAAASEAGHDLELRHSSIGLADVLFQAITYMAPGVGLAFSIGIAVPISGATLPLSVLVALAACTFCAVAIGQLATHIPSAGGLYTYAARGIGPKTGFLVGWFYVGFGIFLPGSLLTLGGWFVDGFVDRELGFSIGWWFWGLIFAASIFCLTFFDVRMSAKATVILGAVELGVFFALGLYMILTETNSTKPFTPSAGADGYGGIFQGAVFAILAFIGFEAASALGEEAKNPKRTVPLGVIGSCVLVGLFYVFMTYSWNVGAHLDIIGHNTATAGSDWDAFGNEYWGTAGAWLLFFALVNSVIACGTASTNNAARVFFAMGRTGNAPSYLGKVHPKYKSPYMSVITTIAVTGTVAYVAAFYFGDVLGAGTDGLSGFVVEATFFTVIAILIYIISCVACIGYFSKGGRASRNMFLHVVVPVIGVIAFILPLYTQYWDLSALFNGEVFTWAYKNEAGTNVFFDKALPTTWSVMGAIVWLIAGIALALYLGSTRPDALDRATQAFGGEVDDDDSDNPDPQAHSMSIPS
ncbi:MAG: APC family permease [Mycobacteriales bacterium]